ncbi:hypothetical protein FB45DRAFT_1059557 [Roridomyces roridus]|uniref:Uncharacterized protein n=1 Tax=Roridomyces roridus TaxID=1738132 RepID=A0AAD7BSB3_9AGAR|nr:hypothetical protein FB45DRAFT_1059557 [Roridomyces roridus]
MQFRSIIALISFAAAASATAVIYKPAQPQPSAAPPAYSCPDNNNYGHGRVNHLSDWPPHQGSLFGCTYNTGHGTGTHSCTYNSRSGACTSKDSRCPSEAYYGSDAGYKKRGATHAKRDNMSF